MAIETAIRSLLLSQGSITSRAPARTIERTLIPGVFCEDATQGFAPPYVIITQIGEDPMLMLSGTTGMRNCELDIDCYEMSYPRALALCDAVQDFFNDYTGAAGDTTINAVMLQGRQHSRVIHNMNGTDVRHHVLTLTYEVQYTE
jgi:hypothetical protein